MTTAQLNKIKEMIGKKLTIHEISRTVREIIDCHDPLDSIGENELIDNGSVSFDWVNENGVLEGVNIIFKETGKTVDHYFYGEQKELEVIGIDRI